METYAQFMNRTMGRGNWNYSGAYKEPTQRFKKRIGYTRTTRQGQPKGKRRQVKASRHRNR